MDKCSICRYKTPCENLNYLDVANTCSDLRKFVDEIRADAINEYDQLLKHNFMKMVDAHTIGEILDKTYEQLKEQK